MRFWRGDADEKVGSICSFIVSLIEGEYIAMEGKNYVAGRIC